MQLLVSVRSAAEVAAALSGGADIIDAKEPRHGSLGPVSAEVLSAILAQVPPDREVSIALGDVSRPDAVRTAIESLPVPTRRAATYVKLGFAGVTGGDLIATLLESAVAASLAHSPALRIVAVGYADATCAGSAAPDAVWRAAAVSGVAGVLLDTYGKSGGNLLTWLDPDALFALIAGARENGLMTAVAGGLREKDLGMVIAAGPDIIGFRGAACVGGRGGRVSRNRVRRLGESLRTVHSGSVQELVP